MSASSPILVLGSTGKTGRRVAQRLRAAGYLVREGSRRADPPFDWERPSTWGAVLAGVERVYVSFYPDLAIPGAESTIRGFTSAAIQAGVKRLVLLSGRGELHAQLCEEVVRSSGVDFTLLRASWFFQNFTEGQLSPAVASGVVALPAGSAREPFIDAEDIAEIAAAALTEDGHAGRLYELTGPRLLSFDEATSEISRAAGRAVVYLPVTGEAFYEGLSPAVGPEIARMLTDLCAEVFDGRNESLGDGVEQALGRPPRDFSDFCRAAAASGVWSAPVAPVEASA